MQRNALLAIIIAVLILTACARPVLKEDLLQSGTRNINLSELASHPDIYKGKLFILGGIISNATVTDEGTLIQAIYVPADKKGRLKDRLGVGRYIAIWPKAKGFLDPMVYRHGRMITVAGIFMGIRKGPLDKTTYDFPVFGIRQIHLFKPEEYYPYQYYAPYYYWNEPYPYYPFYSPFYGFGFEFEQPGEQEEEEQEEFERQPFRPEGREPEIQQPGAESPGTTGRPLR